MTSRSPLTKWLLLFGAPGTGLGLSRRQWVYARWRGRRPFQGAKGGAQPLVIE